MNDGCYNWFKCWLLFFTSVGSLYCGLLLFWNWLWSKWDKLSVAWLSLFIYMVIFAKIQFDAIAERSLGKAKVAMYGFLGYILYFWAVMGVVSSCYNSDVGTMAMNCMFWLFFPLLAFGLGSIFAKRKLVRFEKHKQQIKLALGQSY